MSCYTQEGVVEWKDTGEYLSTSFIIVSIMYCVLINWFKKETSAYPKPYPENLMFIMT